MAHPSSSTYIRARDKFQFHPSSQQTQPQTHLIPQLANSWRTTQLASCSIRLQIQSLNALWAASSGQPRCHGGGGGRSVGRKQFLHVPMHGLPVSLDKSTHINNMLNRVKHDPHIVVLRKVSNHMERSIHVTFTLQTKVIGQY
jgi:hypothetical protein